MWALEGISTYSRKFLKKNVSSAWKLYSVGMYLLVSRTKVKNTICNHWLLTLNLNSSVRLDGSSNRIGVSSMLKILDRE